MRVFVDDGNRHQRASGYGALSRAILLALKCRSDFEIVVKARQKNWDNGIAHTDELLEIREEASASGSDVALRVGTPEGSNHLGIPTAVYTQNALGDLRPEWVASLKAADAIIVPGEFDKVVFEKYFSNVHVCHQYTDPSVFTPIPQMEPPIDDMMG